MPIITLEYRVVHNNIDCGGDNFGTSDVRSSFEIVLAGQKYKCLRIYFHSIATLELYLQPIYIHVLFDP